MRFPRLSGFFQRHRRVRSDPEILRLASAQEVTPETRPASTECVFNLALPPSVSHSSFLPTALFSPFTPFTFPLPPAATLDTFPVQPPSQPAVVSPSTSSTLNYCSSEPVEPTIEVVGILTERIQDLETALAQKSEDNACISKLEETLQAERAARKAADCANSLLLDNIAALQEEVLQLRRVLFSGIVSDYSAASAPTSRVVSTSGPGPVTASTSAGQLSLYKDKNVDFQAIRERDRLRHFVELLISVGAHKPVLDLAYRHILQGEDAELALVRGIKTAVTHQDSVWRQLLEPVTGRRTQEEYLAQLRCTLDARRQSYDWRKKAKFWKRAAKEGNQHDETITPSVSAISEVAEALPTERQERVQEMIAKLRNGELPLQVTHATTMDVSEDETPCPWSSSVESDIEAIMQAVSDSEQPGDRSLPATSSSMVLPASKSSSTARLPCAYSSGPAVVRHSIQTVSISRTPRQSSPISESATRSTRLISKVATSHCLSSITPSLSIASNLHSNEPVIFIASPSEKSQIQPVLISTSISIERDVTTVSSSLPRALVDFGKDSDDDLVLVLSTDFSETSYHASPDRPASAVVSEVATLPDAPSSPGKKSRLPVRMPGLRVIKRLSETIGGARPAQGDASHAVIAAAVPLGKNAGEVGSRARATSAPGVMPAVDPEAGAGAAVVFLGPPSRPTKIPMGKRLQRFGIGGQK